MFVWFATKFPHFFLINIKNTLMSWAILFLSLYICTSPSNLLVCENNVYKVLYKKSFIATISWVIFKSDLLTLQNLFFSETTSPNYILPITNDIQTIYICCKVIVFILYYYFVFVCVLNSYSCALFFFLQCTLIFYVPLVRGGRIDKLQNSISSKSAFGSVSKGKIRRVINISELSSHMMDLYSCSSVDMLLHQSALS